MPTDQELIKIVPSSRQLAYQATEFYAFFHFGMNTYTGSEWGNGKENPNQFQLTNEEMERKICKFLILQSLLQTSGCLQHKMQV